MNSKKKISTTFGGEPVFKFDPTLATFTAGMAKRNSAAPFAAGVMVQGKPDTASIGDTLTFGRGTLVNNLWYSNIDPNQGSVVFWVTPEWNGNDGYIHSIIGNSPQIQIYKSSTNVLRVYVNNVSVVTADISAWVAGTTYCVVVRWDTKNKLDGTNYGSISINDTHTFGGTSVLTPPTPPSTVELGYYASIANANAIIEGLTVYRRPLWDGAYGQDVGNGDEINLIYAAGTGKDPTEITGSWDVCLCVPTNATAGALVTGTGEAWSHPHSSNVLKEGFLQNGYYGGGKYAIGFNGTSTKIDCGSDAGLDNLQDAEFVAEAWFYSPQSGTVELFSKGDGSGIGWYCEITSSIRIDIYCATTTAIGICSTSVSSSLQDGKWHHLAFYFNDAGDRKVKIALDGKWRANAVDQAGVGAIVSDASFNFRLGTRGTSVYSSLFWIGWTRISNNARYTVGTDFIPARVPPAADANTLAQWNMTEGTGTTVDNVGTIGAGADGTITAGTWLTTWEDEGSPVVNNTSVKITALSPTVIGKEASINDLLVGKAVTYEFWMKSDGNEPDWSGIFEKGNQTNIGLWCFWNGATKSAYLRLYDATTVKFCIFSYPRGDKLWHHLAITYDDLGDRKGRVYLDGVCVGTTGACAGIMPTDAVFSFLLGYGGLTTGWTRISNSVRYTTNFTPLSRFACPANDANTVRLFAMNEGAGTVITDTSTNAQNATLANGVWNNTRDLAVDSAGCQMFNGGHLFYTATAGSGIKQTFTGLTAGADYVIRALAFTDDLKTGRPQIQIYDETNGALIKTMDGWSQYEICANGTFDTDTLWAKGTGWTIDTSASKAHCDGSQTAASDIYESSQLNGGLIDKKLYKVVFTISGYSAGTVYPVLGDTAPYGTPRSADGTYTEYIRASITTTNRLRLRADADFIGDIDNVSVTFIPEYNHPDVLLCSFELPTTARSGSTIAPADCTSISVKLLSSTVGVVGWHQVELLPNLLDNPSFDFGAAADPWIPTGWTNLALDAGDSEEEGTVLNSTGKCLQYNTTASGEGITKSLGLAVGKFQCMGCNIYSLGGNATLGSLSGAALSLQSALASSPSSVLIWGLSYWKNLKAVARSVAVNGDNCAYVAGAAGATGIRYIDDAYAFALDDVTLTATPASLANSQESGGIRVDGYDLLTQPLTKWSATKGKCRFNVIPRHSAADVTKFQTLVGYGYVRTDANNYILVYFPSANNICVAGKVGGTTFVSSNASVTGLIVPGTTYQFELSMNYPIVTLKMNGAILITVSMPSSYSTPLTSFGVSSSSEGVYQPDAVFLAP